MLFDTHRRGKCLLISFNKDIDARSDISELLPTVREALRDNTTRFAIEFTPNSYLYSKTIAVLVRCMNTVHEEGGDVFVISSNPKLIEALNMFHLDRLLTVCSSVEELPQA
jgi:anti-anti-sigma factor